MSWIIIRLLYNIDWLIGFLYDELNLNILGLGRLLVTDGCVSGKKLISVLQGDGYNRGLDWVFNFDRGQVQAKMGILNLTEGVIKAHKEGRTQLRE